MTERKRFVEMCGAGGLALDVKRELARTTSPYAEVAVFENPDYGKVLTLDGCVMTTEGDGFIYHEMLVCAPLAAADVESALVVGGGDGGCVKTLLGAGVRAVTVVEIDPEVIAVSREHFDGKVFDDESVTLIVEDAVTALPRFPDDAFDLVCADTTDPVGPAVPLVEPPFLRELSRVARRLVSSQTGSPVSMKDVVKLTYGHLHRVFPHVVPLVAPVPTYPGGIWSFALTSQRPIGLTREPPAGLKYLDADTLRASTAIPPFLRSLFAPSDV